MKILGSFPYNADVVPKGSRKPRKTVLFARIEYDIEEAPEHAPVQDALVLQSRTFVQNGDDGRISMPGWNGRLWRHRSDGVEALARELASPDPDYNHRNPVDRAYDPTFGPRRSDRSFVAERQREEDFVGQVLRTDRPEQAARAAAAARDIAIFGDAVHVRANEPVLLVRHAVDTWSLAPHHAGFQHPQATTHAFRPDRMDDAVEWVRRLSGRKEPDISGRVENAMPEFLTRDDLSNYVSMRLRHLVLDRFAEIVPHLRADAVAAWQPLARIADRLDWRSADVPLEPGLDASRIAVDVLSCYEAAAASDLPTNARWILDDLSRKELRPFKDRVDFEARRRPAPARLADADEEAVAGISPAAAR
jgi:hypothetical protein